MFKESPKHRQSIFDGNCRNCFHLDAVCLFLSENKPGAVAYSFGELLVGGKGISRVWRRKVNGDVKGN